MSASRLIPCALLGLLSACTTVPSEPARSAEEWFDKANRHAERGELTDAEIAYRQSLLLGMDDRARYNLGLVQLRLGAQTLREVSPRLDDERTTPAATRDYLNTITAYALGKDLTEADDDTVVRFKAPPSPTAIPATDDASPGTPPVSANPSP